MSIVRRWTIYLPNSLIHAIPHFLDDVRALNACFLSGPAPENAWKKIEKEYAAAWECSALDKSTGLLDSAANKMWEIRKSASREKDAKCPIAKLIHVNLNITLYVFSF